MSKSLRNTVSPVALARGALAARRRRRGALLPDARHLVRAGRRLQHPPTSLQRYASELGNTLGNLLNRVLPFAGRPVTWESPERPTAAARRRPGARAGACPVRRAGGRRRVRSSAARRGALTALWGLLARGQRVRRQGRALGGEEERRHGAPRHHRGDAARGARGRERDGRPGAARGRQRDARAARAAPLDWKALALEPEALWPLTPPAPRPGPARCRRGAPIFPRFEKEVEADIVERFTPPPAEAADVGRRRSPAKPGDHAGRRRPRRAAIVHDDFARLDLRVGVVVSAERVKKKDKLLDLRIDTGDAAPRRIVAGLAAAYAPEALVGKRVVVLCNLAPRDFGKGLVSEGMLLAAEGDAGLAVLTPDRDQPAGAPVS